MKYNFEIPDRSRTNRAFPRRNRDIEPVNVFHAPAAITDEVMMRVKIRVVARRAAFTRNLANQARTGELAQAVIDGGARNPRIAPVQRSVNLIRSRMNRRADQEFEDIGTLRGPAQSGSPEVEIKIDRLRLHII